MKTGKTTATLARTDPRLIEGSWLVLRTADAIGQPVTPPQNLQIFGAGPFLVVKKINRQVFLRGQQDFQVSIALTLMHFELAPDLKISK